MSEFVFIMTCLLSGERALPFGLLVYFLFYRFFSQQVSVGGRNKNKNKIHSDHFPIELKSKETQLRFLRF